MAHDLIHTRHLGFASWAPLLLFQKNGENLNGRVEAEALSTLPSLDPVDAGGRLVEMLAGCYTAFLRI